MNGKLTDLDIKIVRAFAKNDMKTKFTAEELFFHRNSVLYHLHKVEQVTGLNPFKFYDLVKLISDFDGGDKS